MTHNKHGDDGFVSPEQSLQVYRAMQAGLSRRQALKMLGAVGIMAAGSGLWPGMPAGWAAESTGQGTPRRGGRICMAAHSSSSSESLDPAKGSTANQLPHGVGCPPSLK